MPRRVASLLTALALAAVVPASLLIPTASAAHCYVTGVHQFPVTTAQVFIEVDGEWEPVSLHGPTTVSAVAVGDTGGDGLEEMDTEMIHMLLTGESSLLGGKIEVMESAARQSLGKIEQASSGACFPAVSHFDVFVDVVRVGVDGPSGIVHNDVPVRMEAFIFAIPPGPGVHYLSQDTPIELLMGPSHPPETPPPIHDVVALITHARHTPEPVYECIDGADNDGDGRVDLADGGCYGVFDDTESPDPTCGNGIDDDGDGLTDFREDRGCTDPWDMSEDGPDGGSLPAECNPTQNPHQYVVPGSTEFETSAPGPGAAGFVGADDLCPTHADGDPEYGFGGGFLPAGPWAATCGYTAHHGPSFHVHDAVFPENDGTGLHEAVFFLVGADPSPPTVVPVFDPITGEEVGTDCIDDGCLCPGPFDDDWLQECAHACAVSPPPGNTNPSYGQPGGDGGYWVFVNAEVKQGDASVSATASLQGQIFSS